MVVGWREKIRLPDLKVAVIKAKVDTGARTSALHAEDIKIVRTKSGARVRFTVFPHRRSRHRQVRVSAPFVGYRKVKSSIGHVTERPVVLTTLDLGGHLCLIEITLVNRDIMGFRMLLGRSAIPPGVLVDPKRSYLLSPLRPRRTAR